MLKKTTNESVYRYCTLSALHHCRCHQHLGLFVHRDKTETVYCIVLYSVIYLKVLSDEQKHFFTLWCQLLGAVQVARCTEEAYAGDGSGRHRHIALGYLGSTWKLCHVIPPRRQQTVVMRRDGPKKETGSVTSLFFLNETHETYSPHNEKSKNSP